MRFAGYGAEKKQLRRTVVMQKTSEIAGLKNRDAQELASMTGGL